MGLCAVVRPTAGRIPSCSRTRTAAELRTHPEEAPRFGASPARGQNAFALMISPLARVIRALKT